MLEIPWTGAIVRRAPSALAWWDHVKGCYCFCVILDYFCFAVDRQPIKYQSSYENKTNPNCCVYSHRDIRVLIPWRSLHCAPEWYVSNSEGTGNYHYLPPAAFMAQPIYIMVTYIFTILIPIFLPKHDPNFFWRETEHTILVSPDHDILHH